MESYDKILKLLEDTSLFKEMTSSDIPSIDLYVDQVTTLFNERLEHLKRNQEDVILTKTMINNYTKDKLIMPPLKKKYSKEHIMLLILTYNLKQTLSIHDIQSIFSFVVEEHLEEEKSDLILDMYSSYLNIKEEEAKTFKGEIEQKINMINERLEKKDIKEEKLQLVLMILMLIIDANLYKRLAEKMIDTFFVEEKNDKKKKKK